MISSAINISDDLISSLNTFISYSVHGTVLWYMITENVKMRNAINFLTLHLNFPSSKSTRKGYRTTQRLTEDSYQMKQIKSILDKSFFANVLSVLLIHS